jgi:hypothetical protein
MRDQPLGIHPAPRARGSRRQALEEVNMNAKKFVLTASAVLVSTGLIARAADGPRVRAAVEPQAGAVAPKVSDVTPAVTAITPKASVDTPKVGAVAPKASAVPPQASAVAPHSASPIASNPHLTLESAAYSSLIVQQGIDLRPQTLLAAPTNDLCANAEVVTGPYPTTVCGTTVGATLDCPGVLDWESVWYAVELPYELNSHETDYCAGAIDMSWDDVGIVYLDGCADCSNPIVGTYEWRDCGNGNWNPTVRWRQVPGPATVWIPVYISNPHDFCITFNVTEATVCTTDCPSNGVPENEICGDDTNGGCNMSFPQFESLSCGTTVCGTSWADGGMRDTDWFEITIDEPTKLSFTVESEFYVGLITGLFETYTPGVVGCDQLAGPINPSAMGQECEKLTVTYDALPGTYWWFVGPTGWDGMPCSQFTDYVATMSCEPWEVRGACCDDVTGACTDNVIYQDCPAPNRFTMDELCSEINPPCGGCPESMLEIEILTDRYPSETEWTVTDQNTGAVLCSGGPYPKDFRQYFDYCCIPSDACVDFTITDLAGDGQWPPRGYAVRMDGVELCSTIDSGWAGFAQSCNNIGQGCPAGRCCYDPWPNCADTTFFDCIRLHDGLFSQELSCATDACQDPNACDFSVVAPYTSPVRNNCDGLDRCHPADQYFDTPEHAYCVTIPYDGLWSFNTCQNPTNATWLGAGTSLCDYDLGWNSYTCEGYGAEVVAQLTAGEYYVNVEGYQQCGPYILDIHEVPVCDANCPENAVPEVEPCGETTNNGCWGWPQQFERIGCNQPVCGKVYADNGFDTDWYEFVSPITGTMTWSVRTNFTGVIGIAEQYVPGVPGCDNFTGTINPTVETSDCTDASITFPVVAGGTYYLYVAHKESFNYPCGTLNDYVATVSGACVCGDLDYDNDVDAADYQIFRGSYGRVAGDPLFNPACDYDNTGAVGLGDYQHWLGCYRDYVGNSLAQPPGAMPEPVREVTRPGRPDVVQEAATKPVSAR